MKQILFKGCGTAIATPFNENGVNLNEFRKLLEFQIKNNADAIIVKVGRITSSPLPIPAAINAK